jgi:hypothetical protein
MQSAAAPAVQTKRNASGLTGYIQQLWMPSEAKLRVGRPVVR